MSAALGGDVVRTLVRSASGAGVKLAAAVAAERAWASALFEGVRFTLDLASDDAAFGAWLAALPDADLPLRRYFIGSAELTDRPAANMATIELLAIAEG